MHFIEVEYVVAR